MGMALPSMVSGSCGFGVAVVGADDALDEVVADYGYVFDVAGTQIPYGNDNKKSKCNSRSQGLHDSMQEASVLWGWRIG